METTGHEISSNPKISSRHTGVYPKKNNIKILIIPHLLVNNCLIADFTVETSLFNKLFVSQCKPLEIGI